KSNNLFGIKAGKSWTGKVAEAVTTEYSGGRAVKAVERFRSYATYAHAMQDFAKLMKQNPRYANAASNGAEAYAQSLQKAGYATDPAYGAKLARAIRMVERHASASYAPAPQVVAATADNAESGGMPSEKA